MTCSPSSVVRGLRFKEDYFGTLADVAFIGEAEEDLAAISPSVEARPPPEAL